MHGHALPAVWMGFPRAVQPVAISPKQLKKPVITVQFSWLAGATGQYGTNVSGQRGKQAINKLWYFTAELMPTIGYCTGERGIAVDLGFTRSVGKLKFLLGSNAVY